MSKNCEKMGNTKVKNSEILNTQERAILLDVCGRRQLQVCQNPDLLRGVPVVAGSKAQEERDGGRLSADREQEREVWAPGREVPTAVAKENEKEKVYSQQQLLIPALHPLVNGEVCTGS